LASEGNPAICADPWNVYIPTNSHDFTTPICGWLVPNYFNNDLMVFDSDGNALGYLNQDANWNIPPSAAYASNMDVNIANEHLRRVVKWISAGGSALLEQFLSSMQTAQDNSSPAHAHLYSTKALLMGRPIAVARAMMNIELMGLPAINQNENVFFNDSNLPNVKKYSDRFNNSWDKVKLPYRLGEHFQLDDGLLGYWKEDGSDNLKNLVAPESDDLSSQAGITTFTNGVKMEESTILDTANVFTILLDPRSGVHITSGILPTIKKSIEPMHFLPQLKKIQMWFKVFPLLQPIDSLNENALLNLPKIDDSEWHWYDRFGNTRPIKKDQIDTLELKENALTESYLILTQKK
jgi:hypothetical protein